MADTGTRGAPGAPLPAGSSRSFTESPGTAAHEEELLSWSLGEGDLFRIEYTVYKSVARDVFFMYINLDPIKILHMFGI